MDKLEELYGKLDCISALMANNSVDYEIMTLTGRNETEVINGFYSSIFKDDPDKRLRSYISRTSLHNQECDESILIDLVCEYFSILKEIRIEAGLYKSISK